MQVLELNRKILRLLGLCLECNATRRELYRSAFVNVVILASYFGILFTSATFVYDNYDNLSEAVYGLMQMVGYAAITGSYVSFMLNKIGVFDFFNELQGFVTESIMHQRNSSTINPSLYSFI